MADPHQPFRRHDPADTTHDDQLHEPHEEHPIDDPQHQRATSGNGRRQLPPPSMGRRSRTAIIAGAIGLALALIAAMILPGLVPTPSWPSQPLVMDMATQPEIA